jgi:hypothetical protein
MRSQSSILDVFTLCENTEMKQNLERLHQLYMMTNDVGHTHQISLPGDELHFERIRGVINRMAHHKPGIIGNSSRLQGEVPLTSELHGEFVMLQTLLNETYGWRVYAHERTDLLPFEAPRTPWQQSTLVGFNYYPAETPWNAFWEGFDPLVIAEDFQRVRDLGANSVRVFLTYDAFSNPATQPNALENLAILLDLASEADLKVVPTLFDLKPTFAPSTWSEDLAYLSAILPVLTAAQNVAFIDLKNEPDLDYEAHGQGDIQAWLLAMASLVRHDAQGIPLTIGWSDAESARDLMDIVDLVTYHDYAPIEGAPARLAALMAETDMAVMVTEIGATSYTALLGQPSSTKAQRADLASRMAALTNAQGIFIWTLHDFPDVDAAAVGHSPWVRRLQSQFGVISTSGNEKPAAAEVSAGFSRFLAD